MGRIDWPSFLIGFVFIIVIVVVVALAVTVVIHTSSVDRVCKSHGYVGRIDIAGGDYCLKWEAVVPLEELRGE